MSRCPDIHIFLFQKSETAKKTIQAPDAPIMREKKRKRKKNKG